MKISLAALTSLWIGAASFVAAFRPLAVWIAVEFQKDLPALIPVGFLAYLIINIFTPNQRKHNGLIGVLWWETVEHLVYPLLIIVFAPLCGAETVLVAVVLYLLYGGLLGSAETRRDEAKLVVLITALLMLPAVPSLVLFLDYRYGLKGYISWLTVCAATLTAYMILQKRGRENQG